MPAKTNQKSPANFALYPLFWLAICLIGGIVAARFVAFGWQISLVFCLICAALTVVFLKRDFVFAFLAAAFFFGGALLLQTENLKLNAPNRLRNLYANGQIESGDPLEMTGILMRDPELSANGFSLEIRAEKAFYKNSEVKITGNVRLFAPIADEIFADEYAALDLRAGAKINVACRLSREDEYLNPGVPRRIESLDQQDVDATGTIKSPLLIEKIADAEKFAPFNYFGALRNELIADFRRYFNSQTAGVLIASLLGNRSFLDRRTAEVFREGGTFHVLVISGLHITFIGWLLLLLLRFFINRKFWQFIVAAGILWSYSLAVGADAPVVRATLMFTILLFARVVNRNGTLLNSFGACVIFLLVWRPLDLFTASLQLTLTSVGAIIVCAFPLIEKMRAIGDWKPSSETPFPPQVSPRLKKFCEMLYWRERVWKIEQTQQIWTMNLFKSPYFPTLEKRDWQNATRYLFESVLISFIVQIFMLPLMIIYFHRLALGSIILNLWVGIFIAFESFAAVAALLVAQISDFLAVPPVRLTEFFNWLLVAVPGFFIDNVLPATRVPHYAGNLKIIYLLYFLPLLILAILINRWQPFAPNLKSEAIEKRVYFPVLLKSRRILRGGLIIAQLLLLAIIVFHPFSAPTANRRLQIDFLDVGQGDSALVTFPNGATMLVDGGGRINYETLKNETGDEEFFEPDSPRIGERVVSEFLWQKGYSQIDYLLATHADTDHIQGLTDAAKNFRVQAAFFGRTPAKDRDYAELEAILQKRGIENVTLARGDVFEIGGAKIEVLNPEADEAESAAASNNQSVVIRLTYGAKSFLLTGDIEKETENELLKNSELLKSDVVKVAHHGSRTSSTAAFIEATRANYAIISVGRHSQFGHPHPEIVERWKAAGASIKKTGERGTISISTDGADLQIETFLP